MLINTLFTYTVEMTLGYKSDVGDSSQFLPGDLFIGTTTLLFPGRNWEVGKASLSHQRWGEGTGEETEEHSD
jgi:hypothetical protein